MRTNEQVRERTITVRLTDDDCRTLADKCGQYGLTVGELIENFINDLVDGTYSNGSDERAYIQSWVDRCGFSQGPESLLGYLLSWGYDPGDYMRCLDDIEYLSKHPEIAGQELSDLQEELREMEEGWKPGAGQEISAERESIRLWLREKEALTGE